jgi:hypothetical protein
MGGPPIFYLWRAICSVHGMAGAVGLPAQALLVVMWLFFGVWCYHAFFNEQVQSSQQIF